MSDTLKLLRELSEHFDELSAAADMLEFFLNQMQMHSPKMDGQHHWRLRNGWPMTQAIGSTPEDAILAAMDAVFMSKAGTLSQSNAWVHRATGEKL